MIFVFLSYCYICHICIFVILLYLSYLYICHIVIFVIFVYLSYCHICSPESGMISVSSGASLDPDLSQPPTTSYFLEVSAEKSTSYICNRSLGARWAPTSSCGPSGRLLALRACLTSSFAPFGRSGRVTHATLR